jgi:hypothetical protein
MAQAGVEQLHKQAAGKDGLDAQQALIALASGSGDAAERLQATGVRLPIGAAREPAQRAAEALFNAGGQHDVIKTELARVVAGSEKPADASVLKALNVLQKDANRGDRQVLGAIDAARKNASLGADARAAAVSSLGKAAACGQRGAPWPATGA